MKGRILEVAIKAGPAARFPVGRCPILDSRSGAEEAEEDVARGLDHDANVPAPGDQVAGLRLLYAREIVHADVQV